MKKKNIIVIIILIIIVILGLTFYFTRKKDRNLETSEDINHTVNTYDKDESVNWDRIVSETLSDDAKITKEGTYTLTDKTIENGMIYINTSGNVKLILDNVSITNQNGPAIYVENAESVLIYLAKNSVNTLTDSSSYPTTEEGINSVIYSKDDLIFDGEGTLNIHANYEEGIVSKDNLKIINGTYNIESVDDGIRGKDSVYILNGNFSIISNGDGIKSTNDTDSEKGYVKIENGNFNITSDLDGIQAETKLIITGGNFSITTGGGSKNNSTTSSTWGSWRGDMPTKTSTNSAKGLKCKDNLYIENGIFNLNTSDDSLHSNQEIGIKNGVFTISSGDDGIHADTKLIIDGGKIEISEAYEGIESAQITINDGEISLVSKDDGINVAGGNDSSSINGRPGQNNFNTNSNNILTINGGTIYVNSTGDGIDVNGSGYVYGGYIIVDGPTDSGNGALDYDREFIVDGGTLLAGGASGMAQSVSSNSKINNVTIYFSETISGGKEVSIMDKVGNKIISYMNKKSYSSLVIVSDKLESNSSYEIKIDDATYTSFTQNTNSTTVGNGMGMLGGQKNQGGRQNMR